MSTMLEYFLKLKNCPKLGARARKLDKTEKKIATVRN